jgi:hypothetical protein
MCPSTDSILTRRWWIAWRSTGVIVLVVFGAIRSSRSGAQIRPSSANPVWDSPLTRDLAAGRVSVTATFHPLALVREDRAGLVDHMV